MLNEEQTGAVDTLKKAMISAPVLELFLSERETRIEVDSCATGVGAVLSQRLNSHWKPVAFYSHKFPPVVKNYASREAETYGIFMTIQHWRVFLIGHHFTVISDHQSLVLSSQCKNSRRIQRWLLGLAEYDFDIKYRRGLLHSTPDALSRVWSIDTDESTTEPAGSVFVFRDVERVGRRTITGGIGR